MIFQTNYSRKNNFVFFWQKVREKIGFNGSFFLFHPPTLFLMFCFFAFLYDPVPIKKDKNSGFVCLANARIIFFLLLLV